MRAHRGAIERMGALGGDFLGSERLDAGGGVREVEHHEGIPRP